MGGIQKHQTALKKKKKKDIFVKKNFFNIEKKIVSQFISYICK